jgi:hypothetical protein
VAITTPLIPTITAPTENAVRDGGQLFASSIARRKYRRSRSTVSAVIMQLLRGGEVVEEDHLADLPNLGQ